MAECRFLRLPFVMEYESRHFSLDIAWPEQRLGIEVPVCLCMLSDASWSDVTSADLWGASVSITVTAHTACTFHRWMGQHTSQPTRWSCWGPRC